MKTYVWDVTALNDGDTDVHRVFVEADNRHSAVLRAVERFAYLRFEYDKLYVTLTLLQPQDIMKVE